jgi:hypothetical protein
MTLEDVGRLVAAGGVSESRSEDAIEDALIAAWELQSGN